MSKLGDYILQNQKPIKDTPQEDYLQSAVPSETTYLDSTSTPQESSALGTFGKSFASGVTGTIGSTFKGFSEIVGGPDVEKQGSYKLGEAISNLGPDVTPQESQSVSGIVGQATGSTLGYAGLSALGRAAMLLPVPGARPVGGALMLAGLVGSLASEQAQDYVTTQQQKGLPVNPQERASAARLGGIVRGPLELAPIELALTLASRGKLTPGTIQSLLKSGSTSGKVIKEALRGGALTGLAEGTQEVGSSAVGDFLAKNVLQYDKDRQYLGSLYQDALGGGASGAITGALMSALGVRSRLGALSHLNEDQQSQLLDSINSNDQETQKQLFKLMETGIKKQGKESKTTKPTSRTPEEIRARDAFQTGPTIQPTGTQGELFNNLLEQVQPTQLDLNPSTNEPFRNSDVNNIYNNIYNIYNNNNINDPEIKKVVDTKVNSLFNSLKKKYNTNNDNISIQDIAEINKLRNFIKKGGLINKVIEDQNQEQLNLPLDMNVNPVQSELDFTPRQKGQLSLDFSNKFTQPEQRQYNPSESITLDKSQLANVFGGNIDVQELDPNNQLDMYGVPMEHITIPPLDTGIDVTADSGPQNIEQTTITRPEDNAVQTTDVLASNGRAYKTPTIAKAQLKRKGLTDTHNVTEVGAGWILRPKAIEQTTPEAPVSPSEQTSPAEVSKGTTPTTTEPQKAPQELIDTKPTIPTEERRADPEKRRRIDQLKEYLKDHPDALNVANQLEQELYTDSLTGLKNRRAYEESQRQPVTASIDVDSLKWINDNMGHSSGDEMLQKMGNALQKEFGNAFHISGDEFIVEGATQEEIQAGLERARASLLNETLSSGDTTKQGISFTYGIGSDKSSADKAMEANKKQRLISGERALRGDQPSGVSKNTNEAPVVPLTPTNDNIISRDTAQRLSDDELASRINEYDGARNEDLSEDEKKERSILEFEQHRRNIARDSIVRSRINNITKIDQSLEEDFKQGISSENFDDPDVSFSRITPFELKTAIEQNNSDITFGKTRNDVKLKVQQLKNKMRALPEGVRVTFVANETELTDPYVIQKVRKGSIGHVYGLHIKWADGETDIVLYTDYAKSAQHLEKTLLHELVGHYGMRKIFGKEWNRFLDKVLKNDKLRIQDIYAYHDEERGYSDIPLEPRHGFPTIEFIDKFGNKVKADLAGMRRLADEYIAHLAERLSDPVIKNKYKSEEGFWRRVYTFFKHVMRKFGFGQYAERITDQEVMDLLADSYSVHFTDMRTRGEVEASIQKYYDDGSMTLENIVRNSGEKIPKSGTLSADISFSPIQYDKMHINKMEAETIDRIKSSFSPALRETAWQKKMNVIGNHIKRSKVGQFFMPLGGLNAKAEYSGIKQDALAVIGKMDRVSGRLNKTWKNLSKTHLDEIYRYFTTKDADIKDVKIPSNVKDNIEEAKNTITKLGEALTKRTDKKGRPYLSPEIYEANAGAYLPRMYLKYLDSYMGSGKKPSFQEYLKQRSDLPQEIRDALGEVKDPIFLASTAIGKMGRDVALLDMFNSVAENTDTYWVINDQNIEFDGKSYDFKDFSELYTTLQESIRTEVSILPSELDANQRLIDMRDKAKRMEETMLKHKEDIKNKVTQAAITSGRLSPQEAQNINVNNFMRENYVRMPVSKRYGAMSGMLVRKEIYHDLQDTVSAYSVAFGENADSFNKWFGPGGRLEHIHQWWKLLKVPLNLPSWFRNGIGNLVLLDMSTNTNMGKLFQSVFQELHGALSGTESKYWTMAQNNGLFSTTFASTELYLIRDKFESRIKQQALQENKYKGANIFWMLGESFKLYRDILVETTSNGYSNLEGLFKTAAMKDYIETWEKENKSRFPRGYEGLDLSQRKELERKATDHAQKWLFDYSSVPNFVRQMRRYPLGAPFLTFTYKSFPRVIEAMARRPNKMAKYAMLPYLLQSIMMMANDLDDDDVEEIIAKQPNWMKNKSSVYIMPWKDSNGKWQAMDIGYFLPWSPFVDAGLKAWNGFDAYSPESVVTSGLSSVVGSTQDFGFLGGPIPTVISAMLTNKDSFTNQPIVDTSKPASSQLEDFATYSASLMLPTWIGPYGGWNKLFNNFLGENLNKYGTPSSTITQDAARLVGLNVYGFNPQESNRSNLAYYNQQILAVQRSKSRELNNRNLSQQDRADIVRRYNELLRNKIEQKRKYIDEINSRNS